MAELPPRRQPSRAFVGSLLIVLSAFGFSAMHAVIRHVSSELHAFEIAFFRNLFGFIVLTPFFVSHGTRVLRTKRVRWHLFRGSLQVGAMLMFFSALVTTPLAQASALSFTSPLFASMGAVLLLGERFRIRRAVALVIGFLGALVILRPGAVAITPGIALVLGSSLVWAGTMLVIKHLSKTESSVTLTAWMGIVMTPLTLLPASFVWRWPSAEMWPWLLLLGSVGGLSQLAMAQAFRVAEASAVLPLDFTRLVWASVLGFVLFAEVPEIWTWLGGAIIFASTTYITIREARIARHAASATRLDLDRKILETPR